MRTPPYMLGIDLGTSACKACALDATGRLVGMARAEYPTHCPAPGWAEQDPRDWLEAVTSATRQVLAEAALPPESVAGIALTSAAHIGVLLDADGLPVRPAILWHDQRSAEEVAVLEREAGEDILRRTCQAVSTGWTLPHLRWVARHEPQAWARMRSVVLSKDYLLHWLTGHALTDPATALSSQLYDVPTGRWSASLCALAGITPDQLPALGEATTVVRGLSQETAARIGVPPGTPVVVGTLDSATELLAAGAVAPGHAVIRLASAGGVERVVAAPVPDRRVITYPHLIAPYWYRQAGTNTCATAVAWGKRLLAPDASYAHWDALAEAAPPGADGLLFHPYLAGERAPHWNPNLRGNLSGLTLRHEVGHVARAIYEGAACSIRDALTVLGTDGDAAPIAVVGGGTRSALWARILAAVLGRPLRLLPDADSALGAALLGQRALGLAANAECPAGEIIVPDTDAQTRYADVYQRYVQAQPALLAMTP